MTCVTSASKSTSPSNTSGASRFKRAIICASVFDFAHQKWIDRGTATCPCGIQSTPYLLRNLGPLEETTVERQYVTIEEAAQAVGIAPKTLRNWVSLRKLTEAHGLRRIGSRTNIELPILCEAIARGNLASTQYTPHLPKLAGRGGLPRVSMGRSRNS